MNHTDMNNAQNVSKEPASPVRAGEMVGCEWLEDEFDGYWRTDCNEMHCFTDGGPEDNHHRFCPYCGQPLKAIHCQAANAPHERRDQ